MRLIDADALIEKIKDYPYGYKGYCHAAKHGYYSRNWEIGIYRLYGPDFFCADGELREE